MRVRAHNRKSGQAMVEFSLAFLLFLMMLVGMIEFGRGVWIYTTVAHAAREGARYAIVRGENNPIGSDALATEVKSRAVGLLPGDMTVTTTWEDPTDKKVGTFVRVYVEYPFRPIAAALILPGQSTVRVASTSQMTILN